MFLSMFFVELSIKIMQTLGQSSVLYCVNIIRRIIMNKNQAVQAAEVLNKILSIAGGDQTHKVSLLEVDEALGEVIHVEPIGAPKSAGFFEHLATVCGVPEAEQQAATYIDQETADTIVKLFWQTVEEEAEEGHELVNEDETGPRYQNGTGTMVVVAIGDIPKFVNEIQGQLLEIKINPSNKVQSKWGYKGDVEVFYNTDKVEERCHLEVSPDHGDHAVKRSEKIKIIGDPGKTLEEKLDAIIAIMNFEQQLIGGSSKEKSKTRHEENHTNLAVLLEKINDSKGLISTMTVPVQGLGDDDRSGLSSTL